MEDLLSPSKYNLPPVFGYQNHDISKKRSPAFTIGNRPHSIRSETTPGPTSYEQVRGFDVTLPKAPTYTMGQRFKQKMRYRAPAPNRYNLQGYVPGTNTPAFSFDGVGRTGNKARSSHQYRLYKQM